MMFTAGIGGSLIAWGIAEPIFYIQTPPYSIAPHSAAAMEWAHMYPLFHWGITPWAFYAIPTVPVAYMLFVNRAPMMKISGACEGALPVRGRKPLSKMIDVVIALGIVGGTATSLGLGVPFLLTGLATKTFLGIFSVIKRHFRAVEVVSGVSLIAAGLLITFGRFTLLSGYVSRLFPSLLEIG